MAQVAAPRRRAAMRTVCLALITGFAPMAIDMYLPSLPALGRDLDATPGAIQMTLGAFLLAFGIGQLLYGPLSDRFGRKPPLYAGIALFVLASAGCALSRSALTMIAWRFLQGLGAAAGQVIGRAMVRDLYERDRAARMLSLMALVTSLAPLLAPMLGAAMLGLAGWQAIFGVLFAFGLVGAAAAVFGLPETHPTERRQPGAVRALARMGLALGRDRRFLGYAATAGMMFSGYFSFLSGTPYVFIEVYGTTPTTYALLFGVSVMGLMLGSALNSRLVPKVGVDGMLRHATLALALASLGLAAVGIARPTEPAPLVVSAILFVSCQSLILPNAIAGGLALYPATAGSASAVIGAAMFAVSSAVGAVAGQLVDGTVRPMTLVMAACGALCFAACRGLIRPRAGQNRL